MHAEVMSFVRRSAGDARAVDPKMGRVLDVGSFDMNGSTREIFPGSEYVGIDIHAGPGVDWVGPAHLFPAEGWDGRLFDVLVSTEALEHDPHWRKTLRACCSLVRPGGLIVLTCATGARAPHALHLWPDGYYANLSGADIHAPLSYVAVSGQFAVVRGNEDLQFVGRRAGAMECLHATPAAVTLHEHDGGREVRAALPPELSQLADGLVSISASGATYDEAARKVLDAMAFHRMLGRVE